MSDGVFLLSGRTREAVIDDAIKRGVHGRLVLLQWPPLRDSEARARLGELTTRRTTTFAVRFFPDDQQTTKAYDEYLERYFRFVDNAVEFDDSQTIHEFSATNRTCKQCSSHVSLEYVRGELCPVCGGDLRSNTVQKTLTRWRERIAKVREQGEAEAIKAGWLGSWAAMTVEGRKLEGGAAAMKRLSLQRQYDSESTNLDIGRDEEPLYLPPETMAALSAHANAAGLAPAAYVASLLE